MIAFVSMIFSCLMTFILLSAGMFEAMYNENNDESVLQEEMEISVRHPKENLHVTRLILTSHLQQVLGTHYEVKVWWIRRVSDVVEVYLVVRQMTKGTGRIPPHALEQWLGFEVARFMDAESGVTHRDGIKSRISMDGSGTNFEKL